MGPAQKGDTLFWNDGGAAFYRVGADNLVCTPTSNVLVTVRSTASRMWRCTVRIDGKQAFTGDGDEPQFAASAAWNSMYEWMNAALGGSTT